MNWVASDALLCKPDCMREVTWIAEDSSTVERCHLSEEGGSVRVSSVIEGFEEECAYELEADSKWAFRALNIRFGGRTVAVAYDDDQWRVNGAPRCDLSEAREVDISVSPFSNTLPIRRMQLTVGESVDIVTAYVTLPDLAVTTDPQRYTRVSETEYLYESRDSDFRRTISVDEGGLVIDYPGLFKRA